MTDVNEISRRDLLTKATAAIGAFIGVGLAAPAIAYIIGPALRQQAENWLPLGSTRKVEVGTPTLFKTTVQRQTGWIESEEEIAAYVLTDNGRDYVAMSNVCTHLGCRVRWVDDRGEFFCPCHNGVFDKQGNVVSGPPPRPLNRYEVKVEDDRLLVKVG